MRVTRAAAAAAAQIFGDENGVNPNAVLPTAPQHARAPLGEITTNLQLETVEFITADDLEKPTKTTSDHTPSQDGPERAKFADETVLEVLSDDEESDLSSAAEEASRELLRETLGLEPRQRQVRKTKPTTPPSKAVKRVRKQLKANFQTPKFDPQIHKSPYVLRSPTRAECLTDKRRDSFLDVIESRSPTKALSDDPLGLLEQESIESGAFGSQEKSEMNADMDSSFDSPFDSPAASEASRKRRSRIEDSFDALDAMEDILDEVKESLANVNRPRTASSSSPDHRRHSQPVKLQEKATRSAPETPRERSRGIPQRAQAHFPSHIAGNTPTRSTSAKSSSKPLSSVSNNSRATRIENKTKPVVRASKSGPSPAHKLRPSVTSTAAKKPFVPAKSQKQPTAPTFTLPGEAVSARIKAQREARLAATKAVSTANVPSTLTSPGMDRKRNSSGPEVRMTATALARLSIARGEKPKAPAVQRTRLVAKASPTLTKKPPTNAAAATTLAVTDSAIQKATATKASAPTQTRAVPTSLTSSSAPANKPIANTPVKRSARPAVTNDAPIGKTESGLKRTASTRSMASLPAAKRPAVTSTTTTMTTTAASTSKMAPMDRAEAARRARAEAAERGRQASREWAEKMRKRNSGIIDAKAAETTARSSNKQ